MKKRDQSIVARRLSLYLRAGISLPVALHALIPDLPSPRDKKRFIKIEQIVLGGAPLSKALQKERGVFPTFAEGFIAAGEESGSLPELLEHLAKLRDAQHALSQKITGALAYPLVIAVSTVGIVLFLLLYIFPKILPVLQGLHTQLPLTTRLLLGGSEFITRNWIAVTSLLVLCIFVIGVGMRGRTARRIVQRWYVRVPLFGTLYRYYALSTLSHMLAVLFESGIAIVPALHIAQSVLSNAAYTDSLKHIGKDISSGRRFSSALQQYPKLYPSMMLQLVVVGESTGTLRQNFWTLARVFEEEVEVLTKNLTVLIEPVLMVIMGAAVGFIALAIITPIYQVTQNLHVG